MPTKEYLQLLQKLFVFFKRNGGRNIPQGISQIALVDDDDLTRWFVQLLYKDENNSDFYVSLELVFSEDGGKEKEEENGVARRARHKSNNPRDTMLPHQRPAQLAGSSTIVASRADATPQPSMPSSSGGGGVLQAATSRSECREETPEVQPQQLTPSGRGRPYEDIVASPSPSSASKAGRRCIARMPLVFVVAPRLIAAFIHHGAICSLELMSQRWALSSENMVLLLIALSETLNPFARDGRVSIDDVERVGNRREAVAAAEGRIADRASISAEAYSEEEHQLGMEYIRRAHPHLFRRYVSGPLEASIYEPHKDVLVAGKCRSASRGGAIVAPTNTSTHRDSVGPSSSANAPQTALSMPSLIELGAAQGNGGSGGMARNSSGELAPPVLRDVSHLNTALYDALLGVYAPLLETAPVTASPPSPLLSPVSALQQLQRAAARGATPTTMLLDSPALLMSADGAQEGTSSTMATADGKSAATVPTISDVPPSGSRVDMTCELGSSLLSMYARPPARSCIAYAPTHSHRASGTDGAAPPPLQQRVAELWIPMELPSPPSPIASMPHGTEAGVSCDDAAVPLSLDVCLIGDAGDNLPRSRVACVLRNVRVSTVATRKSSGGSNSSGNSSRPWAANDVGHTASSSTMESSPPPQQVPPLRLSLPSSTATSSAGRVHTCLIPRGLTLRCTNMYLYGHLRVLGNLVLDNCIFVGTLTTEKLASLQVSHSHLALMPDVRLLQVPRPRSCCDESSCHRRGLQCAAPHSSASPADALRTAAKSVMAVAAVADPGLGAENVPPPALLYAQRRECLLILDSSRVEISEDTHVYRLMPDLHVPRAVAHGQQGSTREAKTEEDSVIFKTATRHLNQDKDADKFSFVRNDRECRGSDVSRATAPRERPTMAVLRSIILVSNQGRLRLVRCTVHPGRNTERTILAEQDAIVDMAYCTVTAATLSAVTVQGCRAYLEHCLFEGNHTTTYTATSDALLSRRGAVASEATGAAEQDGDHIRSGGGESAPSDHHEVRQQCLPPPVRVDDVTRTTGLHVELGGTLTSRYCVARHLYFGFCVITHSVANFYCCHADSDVVNGFTVDASAATLDGCSTRANHVGAFVLQKAKCIVTDDRYGSFPRRCRHLGEAHEAARRMVTEELEHQKEMKQDGSPTNASETEPSWESAAAANTARVALLARRHYAQTVRGSDTLDGAAPTPVVANDAPEFYPPTARIFSSPEQTLGFFGGRFGLEVRDAALKAIGVTLMNAQDACVYAYGNSTVELEECVLWSTAEDEAAASAAVETEETTLGTAESPTRENDNAAPLLPSVSPPQRSCGVKVVCADLKARQCLIAGHSFGLAAMQSAQVELLECFVTNAMNGYTIDRSQCQLRHCGADTSHVGVFAVNHARVEAASTPHVVGARMEGRTPPPLICGGVPAVLCGGVYGVECHSSEIQCTGITVLRGRDSGFNAYSGSVLHLSKCLVDMSPTDAASYVFHWPKNKGSPADKIDPVGPPHIWARHLKLGVRFAGVDEDMLQSASGVPPASSVPSPIRHSAPSVGTTGVKVWSDSRCYTHDTEARCVTFGFACLGPGAQLEAHHCTAKHVVNGYTTDGGVLRLTKCSARSDHVGVYILSNAHCVVRRGSYAANTYGIECRCSVLSLQGHVKIYNFSRIGLYLYDGAHCEADPDGVVNIHSRTTAAPQWPTARSVATPATQPEPSTVGCATRPTPSWKQKPRQPPKFLAMAPTVSCLNPKGGESLLELRPACIALADATVHVPQALLGGGARCGITCGDGATGFIGKCIVYDCSVVGVNIFAGGHLTLANCSLLCEQQYALIVRLGGVCRITRNAEDGEVGEARGNCRTKDIPPGPRLGAVVQYATCAVARIAAMPWRAIWQWAVQRDATDEAAALTGAAPIPEEGGNTGLAFRGMTARSLARRWAHGASTATGAPPSLWRSAPPAESRSAASPRTLATAIKPPVAIRGDGVHEVREALLSNNANEEVGGCRVVGSASAAQPSRLRWLSDDAHLCTPLAVRLDRSTMPGGPTHAEETPPGPATSEATASDPVLPPVRPVVCGSCIILGTCTIERVVLRPTSHLPQIFSDCSSASTAKGEERREEDKVAVMTTETTCTLTVPPMGAPHSLRKGQGGRTSPEPQRNAGLSHLADSTTSAARGGGDGIHAYQPAETRTPIKTEDDTASLPSVRMLRHLTSQPPGVYVGQQGQLNLIDCVVDVSLCSQPSLGAGCAEPLVSAVVTCEGPCAKLCCDYVRVVRGKGSGDEDYSAIMRKHADAPGAAQSVTLPSPLATPALSVNATSSLLSARHNAEVAAATKIATVPLLLVSLVDGAQCTLHMVGTSLDDWPYSAYMSSPTDHDCDALCGDSLMRSEKQNVYGNVSPPTASGDSAAVPIFPARLTGARNTGVMVHASGDTFVNIAYANIAGLLASKRSQVRLDHSTVTGMVPLILGRDSNASLTFSRLVGGVRAGPASAAVRVDGGSDLILFRSSVWTLSQGPAVDCIHGGRLHSIESEVLALGAGGVGDEKNDQRTGASEDEVGVESGAAQKPCHCI